MLTQRASHLSESGKIPLNLLDEELMKEAENEALFPKWTVILEPFEAYGLERYARHVNKSTSVLDKIVPCFTNDKYKDKTTMIKTSWPGIIKLTQNCLLLSDFHSHFNVESSLTCAEPLTLLSAAIEIKNRKQSNHFISRLNTWFAYSYARIDLGHRPVLEFETVSSMIFCAAKYQTQEQLHEYCSSWVNLLRNLPLSRFEQKLPETHKNILDTDTKQNTPVLDSKAIKSHDTLPNEDQLKARQYLTLEPRKFDGELSFQPKDTFTKAHSKHAVELLDVRAVLRWAEGSRFNNTSAEHESHHPVEGERLPSTFGLSLTSEDSSLMKEFPLLAKLKFPLWVDAPSPHDVCLLRPALLAGMGSKKLNAIIEMILVMLLAPEQIQFHMSLLGMTRRTLLDAIYTHQFSSSIPEHSEKCLDEWVKQVEKTTKSEGSQQESNTPDIARPICFDMESIIQISWHSWRHSHNVSLLYDFVSDLVSYFKERDRILSKKGGYSFLPGITDWTKRSSISKTPDDIDSHSHRAYHLHQGNPEVWKELAEYVDSFKPSSKSEGSSRKDSEEHSSVPSIQQSLLQLQKKASALRSKVGNGTNSVADFQSALDELIKSTYELMIKWDRERKAGQKNEIDIRNEVRQHSQIVLKITDPKRSLLYEKLKEKRNNAAKAAATGNVAARSPRGPIKLLTPTAAKKVSKESVSSAGQKPKSGSSTAKDIVTGIIAQSKARTERKVRAATAPA